MLIKSASEIISSARVAMRDTLSERWTDAELWAALNESVAEWHGRVSYPATYSFGYVDSETELTIPYYIKGDLQPQHRDYANYDSEGTQLDITGEEVWKRVAMYEVLDDEDGTRTLVIPGSTRERELRCIFWSANGPFPSAACDVPAGGWTSDATTLVVDMATVSAVPDVGYVKVGDELIYYAGVTYAATSVTLSNCKRGVHGTTAAVHAADAVVSWCVVFPSPRLEGLLATQMRMYMHAYFLTNASPKETEQHTWLMRWWRQEVTNFWRTWIPQKPVSSHLTMRSRVRERVHRDE